MLSGRRCLRPRAAAAAVLLAALVRAAGAASLTVDTTTETVDGNTSSIAALLASRGADGKISLREAVTAANNSATSGPHAITLPAGTITLSSGTLTITSGLTITGAGAASTTVKASGARHFTITGSGGVTLSSMRLTDGWSSGAGGAINNTGGALTLSGVTVASTSSNSNGGVISHTASAPLTLSNSSFSGHWANGHGGVVYQTAGTLTVSQCTFGSGSSNGNGGALRSSGGDVAITDSSFTSSYAPLSGGVLYYAGTGSITISGGTYTNNNVGEYGGVVRATSTTTSITVTDGTYDGNGAQKDGGVFYVAGGDVTLTRGSYQNHWTNESGTVLAYSGSGAVALAQVAASSNWAQKYGGVATIGTTGAITVTGGTYASNGTSGEDGGALRLSGGTVTITGGSYSSHYASKSGGAISIDGGTSSTISGVQFSGNQANRGAALSVTSGTLALSSSTMTGGWAGDDGGGLYYQVSGGSAQITNVTISGNGANDDGGGVLIGSGTTSVTLTNVTIASNHASDAGGGLRRDAGTVSMRNSIVADNTSGGGGSNCSGSITTLGNNLESANSCGFSAGTDKRNTAAGLAALADNGGGTTTRALNAGSAAIDAGTSTGAPATDQRGYARVGATDIGAYESGASPGGGGATVGGFNAYDTGTAAGSLTGPLGTRVADAASSVDVVVLNAAGTALHAGHTGTVSLTWLDARDDSGALSGSCRSSWTVVGSDGGAGTATFSSNSRVTVSVTPPAAGTRRMRLRLSGSSGGSTVTACSGDAFAVIPSTYTLSASDADAATAGTTRTLDNVSATGGTVHRAGRPFTVRATARSATGATMTAYDGTPTLAVAGCVLPAGCSAGALTAPSTAASGGSYTNSAVSYAEVGAVSVQLSDASYADVDAADTPLVTRTVTSPALAVGRFVPDSYAATLGTPGQFATANGACLAAGSGATFVNQGFGWATAPVVTVTARNAAGATTTLWSGTLMKLTAAMGGASISATGTGAATVSASYGTYTVAGLGSGQARYTASTLDRAMLTLPDGSAQASVTPVWTWSWTLTDASEAGVSGNPTLTASTSQSPVGWSQGAVFHSARLSIAPGHGDARAGVRQALQLQRYTSAGWVTMTEDRGCVTVQRANLAFASGSGAFASSVCSAPLVPASVTTSGGRAWLPLASTPGAAQGRVLVRVAGGGASGSACTALHAAAAVTPLATPWLLGGATAAGPVAMATWGRPNREVVWRRESF